MPEEMKIVLSAALDQSIIVMLGFWGIMFLGTLSTWAWNFVDDNEKPIRQNILTRFFMDKLGYEPYKGDTFSLRSSFQRKGDTEGKRVDSDLFILPLYAMAILSPYAIAIFRLYPSILISLGICVAVLFMARFMRRHKKLFDKHVMDKDAHK